MENLAANAPATPPAPAVDTELAGHLKAVQDAIVSGKLASVVTQLTAAQTAKAEMQALHESYAHRSLVALDQFVNVLTDGDPDETISARAGRAAEQGKQWGIDLCKLLNKFQANHDPQAQAGDVARAEQVIALERGSGALDEPETAHSPESAALPPELSIADVSHATALDLLNAKSAEEESHPLQLSTEQTKSSLVCGHTETQRGAPTGRVCVGEVNHDGEHQYK